MREINIAAEAGIDLAALRRGRALYMTTCTASHGPKAGPRQVLVTRCDSKADHKD